MYVILFLVVQLIFGNEVNGVYMKVQSQLQPQEPWRVELENDLNTINDFIYVITRFSTDWNSFKYIKSELIMANKINFEIIWKDWDSDFSNFDRLKNCDSITYKEWEKKIIPNQYAILQDIIVKPIDMYKNYIEDTLQYLDIKTKLLKEFVEFKLKICGSRILLNCTVDRKWISDEFKVNRIALQDLEDKTKNIFELLRTVSYNMHKHKYTTAKKLVQLKNRYGCCLSGKIACTNVTIDQFEPLDFDALYKLDYNLQSLPQEVAGTKEIITENPSQID